MLKLVQHDITLIIICNSGSFFELRRILTFILGYILISAVASFFALHGHSIIRLFIIPDVLYTVLLRHWPYEADS